MGVRTYESVPPRPQARRSGPGLGSTLVVVIFALVLLLANGRPIGTPDTSSLAGRILRGALALASVPLRLDATGEALVGKALAALFAALAAGALFAAVARRHALDEARWGGLLLAMGTTLAAASQCWSGEAPATFAVATTLWLLARAESEESARWAALAGLPLGLALAFQPSTLALVAVLSIGVLVRWRWAGLAFAAGILPGAALAAVTAYRHGWVSTLPLPTALNASPAGLLALLVSPAKGAFVFAPVTLVGLFGVVRVLRRTRSRHRWDEAVPSRTLPLAAAAAAGAHLVWVGLTGGWSGGVVWGPRLVAPAWPLVLFCLPEGFALLGSAGVLLALLSVAVQALGAFTYDGRWDRLYRGPSGTLGAAMWDASRSPIVYQVREGPVRLAFAGLEGRRLVVHEHAVARERATGSFVSFAREAVAPTGVDATMTGLRFEGGARVMAGHLELRAAGDAVAFRVREGAWPRRLEIRVVGRGQGTVGVGEGDFRRQTRWREQAVSGAFRLRLPYFYPESGGADVRVALRGSGSIDVESVALVPPNEPENVIRLR
jgi:MFS family permease